MYSTWTLHTQGPDEPIYVIENGPAPQFIARLDEADQTRAEALAKGFMLAATPELFVHTIRFVACLESMLRGRFAPSRETLEFFAQEARAAAEKASYGRCDPNGLIAVGAAPHACETVEAA
jgi:hypothetical protein